MGCAEECHMAFGIEHAGKDRQVTGQVGGEFVLGQIPGFDRRSDRVLHQRSPETCGASVVARVGLHRHHEDSVIFIGRHPEREALTLVIGLPGNGHGPGSPPGSFSGGLLKRQPPASRQPNRHAPDHLIGAAPLPASLNRFDRCRRTATPVGQAAQRGLGL